MKHVYAKGYRHNIRPHYPNANGIQHVLLSSQELALWRSGHGREDGPAGRMAGFGSVTYRLLSSPAHGAEFGLAGRLQKTSSGASIPGKDSITLAKHLIRPLVAYVEMGDRRLAYFGWDDEPWRHERETTLRLWRGHAEIEIRD